jgi:hypothetical protein
MPWMLARNHRPVCKRVTNQYSDGFGNEKNVTKPSKTMPNTPSAACAKIDEKDRANQGPAGRPKIVDNTEIVISQ